MLGTIYVIKNLVNGKLYVGQTIGNQSIVTNKGGDSDGTVYIT